MIVPGVMDSFVLYDFGKDLEHPAIPAAPETIAAQIAALPRGERDEAVHAEEILRLLDKRQSEEATQTATIENVRSAEAGRRKRARRLTRQKKAHRGSSGSSGLMLTLLAAAAAAMSLAAAYIMLQR